jgi:hypothetical protein
MGVTFEAGVLLIPARSMVVDGAGNCYFTELFWPRSRYSNSTLGAGLTSGDRITGMESQMFVAKIAPDGTGIWLTQISDESDPSDLLIGGRLSFDDNQNLYLSARFDNMEI